MDDDRNNNAVPFRLPVRAKLIALWNLLLEIIAGVPYIFLMSWVGDDWGAGAAIIGGLLFAAAHTAGSVFSYRHYERKYGIVEWRFVLLNVLPLLILAAGIYVVLYMKGRYGTLSFGAALVFGAFSVCFGGYSAVYGAMLSAALGIRHKLERRRT